MTKLPALLCLLALAFAVSPDMASAQSEGRPPIQGDAPPPERARDTPSPAAPGGDGAGDAGRRGGSGGVRDKLKVSVLTFSPGDHPFYKFGHNAILIYDEGRKGRPDYAKVYNYGMFTFGDPALIPKFFLGRFMYWVDVQSLRATIAGYKRENRAIVEQELDLDPETELELQRALEENLLPENKYYKYDYYRDNCSTRVRDMLDRVLGGRISGVAQGPARLTYREHTLRLTESLPAEYVILNLVMGDLIDKPINEFQEAFIPMELQKTLRKVTIVHADGEERPLVKSEKTILASNQIPPPEDPPVWWPYALVTGLVSGGGLLALGRAARTRRVAKVALGAFLSLAGLVFGFFGWFFLAAWAFTDHAVGYGNENVMLCVPWAIVLTGTGINVARSKPASVLRAFKLVRAALAAAILATAVKALPWFDQSNGFFLVFFVPFWAGAFLAMRALVSARLEDVAPTPSPGKSGESKGAGRKGASSKKAPSKKAVATDAGSEDAGSKDAGSEDAGSKDAGSEDAGSKDAGSADAGSKDAG